MNEQHNRREREAYFAFDGGTLSLKWWQKGRKAARRHHQRITDDSPPPDEETVQRRRNNRMRNGLALRGFLISDR